MSSSDEYLASLTEEQRTALLKFVEDAPKLDPAVKARIRMRLCAGLQAPKKDQKSA